MVGRVTLANAVKVFFPHLGAAMVVRNVGEGLFGTDALGCEDAVTAVLLKRLTLVAEGFNFDDVLQRVAELAQPMLEEGMDAA
mmetsp:Transcript_118891/g.210159  ORF Transcript_118891/g.210159 Transcript_118891/m.210159 type:complete len:83 (+) Transcript_118891:465-713(+)